MANAGGRNHSLKLLTKIFIVAFIAGTGFLIGRIYLLYPLLNTFSLHVVMSSSRDDVAKLYIDTGQGFSEKNSSEVPIFGDQRFHEYQFALPLGQIVHFRFDPLTTGGRARVAHMDIVNGLGGKVRTMNLIGLKPLRQIKSIHMRDQQLTIDVEEEANDPQLFVPVDPSLTLGIFNRGILFFCARMIAEYVAVILLNFCFLWIWWRRPDWMLRSVLLIALLVFGWRCGVLYREATTPFLRIYLQSSVEGQAQLYYDKGQGFNEDDSKMAYVVPDGQYRECLFPLPRFDTIYAFRFDPLMGSGTMRIRETAIVNSLGHRLQAIDPRLWHAGHQIREFSAQNHEVSVVTEKDADDPQLTLVLSSPLVLNWSRSFITNAFLGRVLLECLIIGIFTVLVLIALKTYLKSASRPAGVGILWDVLFLSASLFLFQVYARGKWEDTFSFIRTWLNG
jgi:hypothetical protein